MPSHKNWITPPMVAVIEGREHELPSKERTTQRRRVKGKVNGPLVQIFELFPELVQFMDSHAKERVRYSTDPFSIGLAFSELYSEEERIDMISALVLSGEIEQETRETIFDNVSERLDNMEESVREQVEGLQLVSNISRMYPAFQRSLFHRVSEGIDEQREATSTEMGVPTGLLVKWAIEQDPDSFEGVVHVPYLLGTAFSISENETFIDRFEKHCLNLRSVATHLSLQDPYEDNWKFKWANPTQEDYQRHEIVMNEIDDEIRDIIDAYWQSEQIEQQDRLLADGVDACGKLEHRDRKILESMFENDMNKDWRSNREQNWNRYDTRRANLLAEERNPPLLSRVIVEKSGTTEKQYRPTNFGQFVYWLDTYIEKKDDDDGVFRDFLSTVPDSFVESALRNPSE